MSQTQRQKLDPPYTAAESLLAVAEHADVHGAPLPGRTKRGLEEQMAVSLYASGGTYRVEKQSGSTSPQSTTTHW